MEENKKLEKEKVKAVSGGDEDGPDIDPELFTASQKRATVMI